MDKRAGLFEFDLLWFLNLALMIFVASGTIYLVSYSLNSQKDLSTLRANVFLTRALYSQEGLSYHDDATGRLYPGILDIDRFRNKYLDEADHYENNRMISANISLFSKDGILMRQFIYNPEMFRIWKPATTFKDYARIKMTRSILIKNGNNIEQGTIVTEVVTPHG
jgi:hypothetical protein